MRGERDVQRENSSESIAVTAAARGVQRRWRAACDGGARAGRSKTNPNPKRNKIDRRQRKTRRREGAHGWTYKYRIFVKNTCIASKR